jgi:hypothetical protein
MSQYYNSIHIYTKLQVLKLHAVNIFISSLGRILLNNARLLAKKSGHRDRFMKEPTEIRLLPDITPEWAGSP